MEMCLNLSRMRQHPLHHLYLKDAHQRGILRYHLMWLGRSKALLEVPLTAQKCAAALSQTSTASLAPWHAPRWSSIKNTNSSYHWNFMTLTMQVMTGLPPTMPQAPWDGSTPVLPVTSGATVMTAATPAFQALTPNTVCQCPCPRLPIKQSPTLLILTPF